MTKPKRFLENLFKPFFSSRDSRGGTDEVEDLQAIAAQEQKIFRYEALAAATGNFDVQNRLGEGGFGPVFKGRLRDGREVAVKQLGRGSRQGAKEFANEATLLSRVQHKNVVNLYGYCAHGDDKLLVYEFVPNQSLDKLLFTQHANNSKKSFLNWTRRYNVMIGVARGLLYLHEDAHIPIIHRDIKASNILLDDRWVPKIADFGMARLYPEDKTINTRVAGTNGYMAPEYVMHGKLSPKADVFSFGVLVLELISGQKNSGYTLLPDPEVNSLVEWAWKLYKKGRSLELMDPAIKSSADQEQVAMCVKLGLLCAQADPSLRPDMKQVVLILSKRPTVLEEPTRPGMPGTRWLRRNKGTQHSSYISGESSAAGNTASTDTSTATNTASTSATATTIRTRARSNEDIARRTADSKATISASTSAGSSSRSYNLPKSRISY